GPMGDSAVYLLQAREIAHGTFGTPAQLAFSPLYGYVLALLTGGEPSLLPIVLQLAVGVLNVWLMYRLTRRFFDEPTAITSASLMVGYAALLFLESKLLSETLGLSLALLCMLAFCPKPDGERSRGAAFAAGVVMALAVLMRASMVFCLPMFALCTLPPAGERLTAGFYERLRHALLLGLGACLVLSANGLWNRANSGLFVPVIMVSSTLEKSAQHDWNGSILSYGSADKIPSPFDVVKQAAETMARAPASDDAPSLAQRLAHFNIAGFIRGAPGKLLETFQTRETFHEYGFLGERDSLPVLRALPVSVSALAVLAALGVWALWRAGRGRELWLLAPLLLGTLATTTLYHPSSRYRLPLIIPLLVLAGHGACATLRLPSRLRPYVGGVAAVAVLALTIRFEAVTLRNRPLWLLELAFSSFEAGEFDAAHAYARQAQSLAPRDPVIQKRSDLLFEVLAQQQRVEQAAPGVRPP
ncbi:MAG TPA: glycosyltransferase family 39 protein, partial [Polyangiales bacterium]|nr:glycosyltransferase family 39 protein [Polyangiales bacterium]